MADRATFGPDFYDPVPPGGVYLGGNMNLTSPPPLAPQQCIVPRTYRGQELKLDPFIGPANRDDVVIYVGGQGAMPQSPPPVPPRLSPQATGISGYGGVPAGGDRQDPRIAMIPNLLPNETFSKLMVPSVKTKISDLVARNIQRLQGDIGYMIRDRLDQILPGALAGMLDRNEIPLPQSCPCYNPDGDDEPPELTRKMITRKLSFSAEAVENSTPGGGNLPPQASSPTGSGGNQGSPSSAGRTPDQSVATTPGGGNLPSQASSPTGSGGNQSRPTSPGGTSNQSYNSTQSGGILPFQDCSFIGSGGSQGSPSSPFQNSGGSQGNQSSAGGTSDQSYNSPQNGGILPLQACSPIGTGGSQGSPSSAGGPSDQSYNSTQNGGILPLQACSPIGSVGSQGSPSSAANRSYTSTPGRGLPGNLQLERQQMSPIGSGSPNSSYQPTPPRPFSPASTLLSQQISVSTPGSDQLSFNNSYSTAGSVFEPNLSSYSRPDTPSFAPGLDAPSSSASGPGQYPGILQVRPVSQGSEIQYSSDSSRTNTWAPTSFNSQQTPQYRSTPTSRGPINLAVNTMDGLPDDSGNMGRPTSPRPCLNLNVYLCDGGNGNGNPHNEGLYVSPCRCRNQNHPENRPDTF